MQNSKFPAAWQLRVGPFNRCALPAAGTLMSTRIKLAAEFYRVLKAI